MRPLRTLLAGLVVLTLSGCQSLTGGSSARLQGVLDRQELRVGLSASQPPLNMRNKRGEIVGLDVDVVKALAASMGVETRFVVKPFGELLPALEKGEVDLVISGMTITAERNARVAFAGPYLISGKSVLTRDEKIANVVSAAALDDPDRTYAALAGSTSEAFVKDVAGRARLVTTPDYGAAVQQVLDGKVDALIADFPICKVSILRHPDAGLHTLATPFTAEPLGIALPAGAPLFVNLVENYLKTLENTGQLAQYKARWFSYGSWVSELP